MKLLTKEIRKKLPPLGATDDQTDPIEIVKFFNPTGIGTWWACEFDPESRMFFGKADLGFPELGSFSLDELQSYTGPFGLGIERDIHFTQKPLSQCKQLKDGADMKIAIDLDNTITYSPEFFRILTKALIAENDIFIITNRDPHTMEETEEELSVLGIRFNKVVLTGDKAEYIKENGIQVFIDDVDEYHLEIDENVLVFKIREPGNFDFAEKKWITSKRNSIFID